jgi:N-acyl amino acid synthase of PEP-CTERM/exosortase system
MVPAISDDLKKEVYKLRYQVYCVENEFLNPEHYPDNLEFDEFDPQSIHYLIRHRKSGDYAATVRLILPDSNNMEKKFPLELNCEIDNVAVMQTIDRKHLAEVSRLCVSKAFRKRKNEHSVLDTVIPNPQRNLTIAESQRSFPLITIALISCMIKASIENNIYCIYATAEPSMFRFVSALGINFIQTGPLSDYHGERYPAVIKIADMLADVAEKNPAIWNLLTKKGEYFNWV